MAGLFRTMETSCGSRRLPSRCGRVVVLMAMLLTLSSQVIAEPINDDLLREKVKSCIEGAQDFLLSQQQGNGSFETGHLGNEVGANSLVGLALLTSGVDPKHKAIQKCLRYVRSLPETTETYDIGLAIMFFSAAGEEQDKVRIRRMAEILIEYQTASGGWGYGKEVRPLQSPPARWDNSTTQFAVLGLREASFRTGMEIDQAVWRKARDHWINAQPGTTNTLFGAGWGYDSDTPRGERGSMTVAGLASLEVINSFIVEDVLTPDGKLDCCGSSNTTTADEAIEAGIRWMNNNINIYSNPGSGHGTYLFYYLYGLERAGKFTGQRFFGRTDWYREGAVFFVGTQSKVDHACVDPGESPVVSTSFALLFLSKGLSPVLINKLQYGPRDRNSNLITRPDWNRHRHDVANLVDYISNREQWPHYLSWQTLDLQVAVKGEGVSSLQQAPIAYLSGDQNLDSITDEEVTLLRDYIHQGGFLFAVQNCESPAFDLGFRQLIQRMFPNGDYALRKLDNTHDVYRSEHLFPVNPPELWGVDFGCRTAIMYAPYDHSCRWDKWMRNDNARTNNDVRAQVGQSMRLGINVVAYATGRELLDKLQRPGSLAEAPQNNTRNNLIIGRLKHAGGWDTAASAVVHLKDALNKVQVATSPETPILAASDPALFACPVLYMHGRKNFTIAPEEAKQLKAYFANGGFLMADACCGAEPFDKSFRKAIKEIFGQELQKIPPNHEMFHSTQGFNIGKVKCRIPETKNGVLFTEESERDPDFEGIEIEVNGKKRYVVVYSKYDISCALERQQTVACAGYLNGDAVKLAVNIVLYSLYQ